MAFHSTRPTLKSLVHRLDLSGYTTRGTRMSESRAKSVVTSENLGEMLRGCDGLEDLLVGEELMDVFQPLPLTIHARLRTLDLTGFTGAVRETGWDMDRLDDLENISFYHSTALSQEQYLIPLFRRLSSRGVRLKRLDLGQTKITSALFSHLPSPERLSHLSLRGCHALVCCSDLVCYLERCRQLIDLKLSGRFCPACVVRLLRSLPVSLHTLDLTGLDAVMAPDTLALLPKQLRYLSLANISLRPSSLLPFLPPTLTYLNLERPAPVDLLGFLQHPTLQVIEISTSQTKGYPDQWGDWQLKRHGRRLFYAKVDPAEIYSKKIILSGHPLSPMHRYWCFAL